MTNPKKNRKVFNIILAIVLAVGVWLYVINVENPTGTVPIRDIPVSLVGEDSLAERGLMVTDQSRDSVKRCAVCGAAFTPKSNRAKYCPDCAVRMRRKQEADRQRKRYLQATQLSR